MVIKFLDYRCYISIVGTGYASCGKLIYVHCKAGRGRSTTVVLCYLVCQILFVQLKILFAPFENPDEVMYMF
jgi:hypothetical protein